MAICECTNYSTAQVSWHDLAFFDAAVYESLRKTILDSREPDGVELLASLGLTFAVTLSANEGGKVHELKEGGTSVPVTPGNVYEYVKRYAELRMVEVCREALEVCLFARKWVWFTPSLPHRRCVEACTRCCPNPFWRR